MKPINELEDFLLHEAFMILDRLSPGTQPLWGAMNAQQMIEHLVLAVEVSNGRHEMQLHTDKEKVSKLKAVMLLSDRPMPREFKNPALPPAPVKEMYAGIDQAKHALKQALELFTHYFRNKVETKRVHNIFGELDYHEWLWFHYKHFIHHFTQFGLLPETSRIA